MELLEKAKNYISDKVTNMAKPEATVTDVDFKGCGFDGITLLAKVNVTNPYSVPIPICEIGYSVKSAGQVVASGTIPDPGSLKGNADTLLNVTVKLPHSALLSLVKDVGGDWDVDYVLDLGLVIDLPVFGTFNVPVQYTGEFKLPTLSELFLGKSEAKVDTSLEESGAKVVEAKDVE